MPRHETGRAGTPEGAGLHTVDHCTRSIPSDNGYSRSGELNSTVGDAAARMEAVAALFAGRGEIAWDDGLLVSHPDWWVSLRPSNTEPLLRLNVEARDDATMRALRDEVRARLVEDI